MQRNVTDVLAMLNCKIFELGSFLPAEEYNQNNIKKKVNRCVTQLLTNERSKHVQTYVNI